MASDKPELVETTEHKHYGHFEVSGNPLAHVVTSDPDRRLPAFEGEFQPGLYRAPQRKFANPAPLGLSCFALTTFILSLINVQARGVNEPNIVIAAAFAYGGVVQLLAGMWEMAVGNTFGATALSSYGGFWISFALILTPSLGIVETLEKTDKHQFYNSMGFFLLAWAIFTAILTACTVKSTLAFFLLFFLLDVAFFCLAAGYFTAGAKGPTVGAIKAGGVLGIMAALLAWYNALAGIADSSNSFFVVPVLHFPWSEKGRELRAAAKENNDKQV